MKKTLFLLLAVFLIGCQGQKGFEDYRSNPFQFPYPEYYLKASVTHIKSNDSLTKKGFYPVKAFGLSFKIDSEYGDKVEHRAGFISVKKKGQLTFVITHEREQMMGCNKMVQALEKDFCSAFDSSLEYFEKLYTLTPEDLRKKKYAAAGNRWIVHHKGFAFKETEKILIYQSDHLTAFRRDFKTNHQSHLKTEIKIFHKAISPDAITLGFSTQNDLLIHQIITTIEASQ